MNRKLAVALAAVITFAACGGGSDDAAPATLAAVETNAPSESEAPVETDAPAETDVPVETDAPAETDAPVETDVPAATEGVLLVPDDFASIQEAVDAAAPGDLVLLAPGTYNEAVNVVTDEITIRGVDRAGVVLDGEFELDNGIRVLGAKGVVVENLTTQNYTSNGVFFTSAVGYRASYITAIRNGDYGVYAFDSINGQIDNSYGAGSPDAGFYVGQCFPCDSIIMNVLSEHNGLGYSGTNSGGNMVVMNSTFRNNRAGVVPNSGSYELCYPERDTTIVGNIVHSNNQADTPAIDVAILVMGNGIIAPGGIGNVITKNLVFDHDKTGISLIPFPEDGANDDLPTEDEWTVTCAEQREQPPADEIPESLIWEAWDNVVTDNVVSGSGQGDLAAFGLNTPTADLRNCFSGNTFETTAPANLETLAPCDGEGSGDWTIDPLNAIQWLVDAETAPPSVDYQTATLPDPPELENMPDAETAPVNPATNIVVDIDLDAIEVPAAP